MTVSGRFSPCLLYTSIDARRECFTPDVHVNSIVVDGGKAPNIIPDYVKLRMEFRTATMKSMGAVDEMVKKCADGAALALDCAVKFTTVFEFEMCIRDRMDGLVIGMDLCDTYTHISCMEPEQTWVIPTVVCKNKNADEWYVEEEAYAHTLVGDGQMCIRDRSSSGRPYPWPESRLCHRA